MKILLTVTNIYAASGLRAFVNLANGLQRRGHSVSFLIDRRKVSEKARPFYPLDEEISIHNIRPWRSDAAPGVARFREAKPGPEGKPVSLPEHLIMLGFDAANRAKQFVRKIRKKWGPHEDSPEWWNLKFGKKVELLRNRIVGLEPDVVIAFLPSSFTYVAQALKDTDIPFLVANRNSPFVDYTAARFRSNKHDVQLRLEAPQIAALNLVQLETYREFFPPSVQAKTRVIPNWVAQVADDAIAHPEDDDPENLILAVGRLHEQKNQVLLVEAFALVATQFPRWNVQILGEGELRPMLEKRIDELGVTNRISLLGSKKDVFRNYRAAKIFAFPSLFEGFSNAHCEAMSHGLPSVGLSSCIYMRETLSIASAGLLSDGTPKDFAARLESLMSDSDLRSTLGQNARKFTKQLDADKILDLWESALSEACIGSATARNSSD